jgi:hypothetical protein
MNYPFKFSVHFTLDNRDDVLEFVKFMNYKNKFSILAAETLLDELGIEKYIEQAAPMIKRKKELPRGQEDMPF